MRIAQLAPLAEAVPPALYGGTERVVSALTEELVRRGHEVTLFAAGDSVTSAALVPCAPRALRLDPDIADPYAHTMRQLGMAYARAAEFDLIHNHLDYFAWPCARLVRTPTLTTMHGRLDLPDLPPVVRAFREQPLVSISAAQRAPLPWATWAATVHNGIDLAPYPFVAAPGAYFAFLGRICPEKNLEGAVAVARATGIPLKIAAKVDPVDADYYAATIKPLIDGRHVTYVGEIAEHEKGAFLGGALALLFAVDWPEPFGLAMAEALACGTPVLALRRGSIPEVVDDGATGFVRDTEAGLVAVAGGLAGLDRAACRRAAEARFSAAAMADGYEAAYRRLVAEAACARGRSRHPTTRVAETPLTGRATSR
jgi:glycosyltransferase involved in cell wall biosynthesis